MEKKNNFIILILAIVIFVAFFLPWVSVESEAVGQFSKLITGEKQASVMKISAFRVPIMANGPDARLMISIIEIFNPNITNADKKSYLIWSIPLLAVILRLLNYFFAKNKWLNFVFALIGILIFAVATYKIKTTDLNKVVINVKTAAGLWLTLWGYLGIGLVSLITFAKLAFAKANKK